MAFDALSFFGGMADQYNKDVAAKAEREEKIQDQIRALQLKSKAAQIEAHQKRSEAAKQVKAYMDEGDYVSAAGTIWATDADRTDFDTIMKTHELDEDGMKKFSLNWLKNFQGTREPTWDDDHDQVVKYSNQRNKAAVDLYKQATGVTDEDTLISATQGDSKKIPWKRKSDKPDLKFQLKEVKREGNTYYETIGIDDKGQQYVLNQDGSYTPTGRTLKEEGRLRNIEGVSSKAVMSSIEGTRRANAASENEKDNEFARVIEEGIASGDKTGGLFGWVTGDIQEQMKVPGVTAEQATVNTLAKLRKYWESGVIKKIESTFGRDDYQIDYEKLRDMGKASAKSELERLNARIRAGEFTGQDDPRLEAEINRILRMQQK